MRKFEGLLVGALVLGPLGCSKGESSEYYFVGRVYDGVSGERLTTYDVQLQYLDKMIDGSVDETEGRYVVGPLEPLNDYTVEMHADGYRSFLSHNAMLMADSAMAPESYYFDAYLFPTALKSPEVTFHFTLADSDEAPSGSIRLRPTTSSSLLTQPSAMPAGVEKQVWSNDEDLEFDTVQRDFKNGELKFEGGALVYGVTYDVTVYNVTGHQDVVASYTAGRDGTAAFTSPKFANTPLAVAFVSTDLGVPVPSGALTVVLNQPFEFDPLEDEASCRLVIDEQFGISSPDKDTDGKTNTLKQPGSRKVAMTIAGDKLTLAWNAADALSTTDSGDPILSATWGGLDAIVLRPIGGDASSSATLGALLGSNSITVPMMPSP